MFSPRQVAEKLGVSYVSVMTYIRNGELHAVDVRRNPHGLKPRYKVSQEALDGFIARRTVQPAARPYRRPKCPAMEALKRIPGWKPFV